MKNLLFLFVFTFSFVLQAQQNIEWEVSPIKYDIDKFYFPMSKYDYYVVNKGKKSGVIDKNGKLVLPIEYTRVEVWADGNFFSGIKNKVQYVFDRKGKSYEWDEAYKLNSKANSKRTLDRTIAQIKRLKNTDIFKLGPTNKSMIIFGANGLPLDTIRNYRNSNFSHGDIYKVNNYFYLISRNAKYLNKEVGYVDFANDSFLVLANGWKYRGIYNYDLEEILPKEYEMINFSKFNDLVAVKKTGEKIVTILDYNLNELDEGEFGYIYYYKDKALYLENKTVKLMDAISKDIEILPYRKFSHLRNTDFVVVYRDTLRGIFDVIEKKEVLAPSHKYVKVSGKFFVGYKKRRGDKHYHFYNQNGDKLIEMDGKNIQPLGKYMFIYNNTTTIIDNEGNIVDDGNNVRIAKSGYLKIVDGDKIYYTTIENYLNGNYEKLHFDGLSSTYIKGKNKKDRFLIAKRGEKYGLITKDGSLVLDFVFDKLQGEYVHHYNIGARYKGKLGILKIPSL